MSNVVKMEDGREVDFGLRGKLKKVMEVYEENGVKTIKLTVDTTKGSTHQMLMSIDNPIFYQLAGHGASQKVTDSIGKLTDPVEIDECVQAQMETMMKGVWTVKPQGASMRGFTDLLEAVRRLKNYVKDSEEYKDMRQALIGKSQEELNSLKSNKAIQRITAVILAEKAAIKAEMLNKEEGDQDDIEDIVV